jgi:pimeloyl-ACP methyl ester carboxylesterase
MAEVTDPDDVDAIDDQLKPTLDTKPTLVFVHGAFEDSAGWNAAVSHLGDHCPYRVFANPLRSVQSDGAALAALLKSIDGPIILIGHSYGGMLISEVGCVTEGVKALVYVAGFAPDAGETVADLIGRFPNGKLSGALIPAPLADAGADLYVDEARFGEVLAADLPAADIRAWARRQRPVHQAALEGAATTPAWRTLPSWFIYGDADQALSPELHAFMAKRAGGAGIEVVEGASHSLHISHPHKVMRFIEQAAMAAEFPVPNLDP